MEVLLKHCQSMKRLSLARNEISKQFLVDLVEGLKGKVSIEYLDLTHLKNTKNIIWKDYLKILENL